MAPRISNEGGHDDIRSPRPNLLGCPGRYVATTSFHFPHISTQAKLLLQSHSISLLAITKRSRWPSNRPRQMETGTNTIIFRDYFRRPMDDITSAPPTFTILSTKAKQLQCSQSASGRGLSIIGDLQCDDLSFAFFFFPFFLSLSLSLYTFFPRLKRNQFRG